MQYKTTFGAIALCFLGLSHVFADGKIQGISIQPDPATQTSTNTSPSMTVATQSGTQAATEPATQSIVLEVETTSSAKKYQIQGVGDLAHEVWTNIGDTFSATSDVTTVSFPLREAFTFFRVVILKKNETLNLPLFPTAAPPSIPSTPPL